MCFRAGTHVCIIVLEFLFLSLSLCPFFIFTLHCRKSEEYILYLATRLLSKRIFFRQIDALKKRADIRAVCLPCVILGLIAKLRVWFGSRLVCTACVRAKITGCESLRCWRNRGFSFFPRMRFSFCSSYVLGCKLNHVFIISFLLFRLIEYLTKSIC